MKIQIQGFFIETYMMPQFGNYSIAMLLSDKMYESLCIKQNLSIVSIKFQIVVFPMQLKMGYPV